ncbi:MAG: adenylate/guanylate cyclase domain-containing protein [Chitinophagaceae bacterium]|nr:adenylate/guanylate cyclase domain-containing protein [Chitinophagaceae bacterium]
MKITASFAKQFEWETLQSEKLRAAILAGYAIFTFIYILSISLFLNHNHTLIDQLPLPEALLIFLAILFTYEIITNRVLDHRLKKLSKSIHPHFKYFTALVELTLITIMLYLYAVSFKKSSLLSDVILVSLYYLIVFLSSFYLDKFISLVTGALAAIAYTILHLMEQQKVPDSSAMEELVNSKYFIYATGILLFLAGVASAFMANQLKKSIMRSVELVEDENKLFNLFSRQISKEIATELLDKDGKVPSSLKFVSVMFIDIRDFTVYAETQTPENLVAFQNAFFGIIIDIINKYHGIVNQFLGDGCMITFGAPIEIENPPRNAIKAALEIKQTLDATIEKGELHPFNIGIGIHCGKAVTGNIGTNLKSEYSITGGVVILAARIEQFNKQLHSQILLSREAFEYANMPELKPELATEANLKGWSHPVELYKLA